MPRLVAFVVFPEFQLLDAAGPIAAFEIAERYRPGTYALRTIAALPGPVASSSGACLQAFAFSPARRIDTLIISGGEGSRAAAVCARTRRLVLACAQRSRRIASVCSGTYVLAAAGLLDGRRATTHWSLTADFSRRYRNVRLDADRIFVRDGKYWSSAGISAGIDLALALIGEDLGEEVARKTAQQLVVYHRRPGGQSQFSPLLAMERADGRLSGLLDHARAHLRDSLSVTELARMACMSPRNFARVFKEEIGLAPAKAVERLRVDAARAALESGSPSIQQVARACGFSDPERMRRSFVRVLGAPPSTIRRQGRRD